MMRSDVINIVVLIAAVGGAVYRTRERLLRQTREDESLLGFTVFHPDLWIFQTKKKKKKNAP